MTRPRAMLATTTPPPLDKPLWAGFRGARALAAAAWAAWVLVAVAAAPRIAVALGATGAVVLVLGAGLVLAAAAGIGPLEAMRRYHLDDEELVMCGPGRRLTRLRWDEIEVMTEGVHAVRLEGRGQRVDLPVGALAASGAWEPMLARVVPGLAAALWERMEAGEEIVLSRISGPDALPRRWWGYGPAAAAAVACGSAWGLAVVAAALVAERAVLWALARRRTVSFHWEGVALRLGPSRAFLPWPAVELLRSPAGLLIGDARTAEEGLLPRTAPNFPAAAAVADLKVSLGPCRPIAVYFRLLRRGRGLAVVGEAEVSGW